MSREEFIGKLQMVYVGDRNAFDDIVCAYDSVLSVNEKAIEYIKENQEHRQGLTVIEYHKKWLEMYDYYESASIMGDLLNILQNGSEKDD